MAAGGHSMRTRAKTQAKLADDDVDDSTDKARHHRQHASYVCGTAG